MSWIHPILDTIRKSFPTYAYLDQKHLTNLDQSKTSLKSAFIQISNRDTQYISTYKAQMRSCVIAEVVSRSRATRASIRVYSAILIMLQQNLTMRAAPVL